MRRTRALPVQPRYQWDVPDVVIVSIDDVRHYWPHLFQPHLEYGTVLHLVTEAVTRIRPLQHIILDYIVPNQCTWRKTSSSLFNHSLFDRRRGMALLSRDTAMFLEDDFGGFFNQAEFTDTLGFMDNGYLPLRELWLDMRKWEKRYRTMTGSSYDI